LCIERINGRTKKLLDSRELAKMTLDNKARTSYIIVGCAIIIGFSILLLSLVDLDGMTSFPDRLPAAPTFEGDYDSIVKKIDNVTAGDTLLKSVSDGPLALTRDQYSGCIYGGFTRTYGTRKIYNDIISGFVDSFADPDWQRNGNEYFSRTSAYVSIFHIDESSPVYALNNGNFETLYSVFFFYGDSATGKCSG
jgi:hypothetical protein